MKLCGIYCITNNKTNKKYIGQSHHLETRISEHKWCLKNNVHYNQHLQDSYNKYGKEYFDFSVICVCSPEELDEKEIYYIALYDTYANGYNRSSGGLENSARETHRKRLNNQNICKECGAETKNGFNHYCENHKGKCKKCGIRFKQHEFHKYGFCPVCGKWVYEAEVPTALCECGETIILNSNRQKYCDKCKKIKDHDRKLKWDRENKKVLHK